MVYADGTKRHRELVSLSHHVTTKCKQRFYSKLYSTMRSLTVMVTTRFRTSGPGESYLRESSGTRRVSGVGLDINLRRFNPCLWCLDRMKCLLGMGILGGFRGVIILVEEIALASQNLLPPHRSVLVVVFRNVDR